MMLKIDDNIIRIHGFVEAMHGMRQPYKGTEKGDSRYNNRFEEVGPKDLELAKQLALAGPVHAKYRRMICVWVDITAPLYWWKEFDTYKVGTVANSESTMHTIAAKPFSVTDFSCEHLFGDSEVSDWEEEDDDYMEECCVFTNPEDEKSILYPKDALVTIVVLLNEARKLYLETKDKKYWWQMIQLLPSSYNQTRTVMLNYEVLSHIYKDRRNHKLDEWHTFCDWIEKLPYAAEMIFPKKEESVDNRKKLQLEIGKAVNKKVADILYTKFELPANEIANAMEIPESVVRLLIKEEAE